MFDDFIISLIQAKPAFTSISTFWSNLCFTLCFHAPPESPRLSHLFMLTSSPISATFSRTPKITSFIQPSHIGEITRFVGRSRALPKSARLSYLFMLVKWLLWRPFSNIHKITRLSNPLMLVKWPNFWDVSTHTHNHPVPPTLPCWSNHPWLVGRSRAPLKSPRLSHLFMLVKWPQLWSAFTHPQNQPVYPTLRCR